LWWGAALVLGVYVSILLIIAFGSDNDGENDSGLGLILAVSSALTAIETVAFLAVLACLRNSLFRV
jgi:hypothetical protein